MNLKKMFAALIVVSGLGLVLVGVDHSPRHVHGQTTQPIYPVGSPAPLLRGSIDPVSSGFTCGTTLDGVQYLNQTTTVVWTCNGTTSTWFTTVPVIAAGSIPLSALVSGITTVNGTPCTLGSSCAPPIGTGTVTAVTGTAPVVVTGTTAPVVSCPTCLTAPGYIKGTSGTITGTLLAAGGIDSGTVAVTGATVGERCGMVSTTDGTNPSSSVTLSCRVATAGVVTVEVTAAAIATPLTKSYNFTLAP